MRTLIQQGSTSRAAIFQAHKAKTPTLNICGALDRCTPPEEAAQFHNALLQDGTLGNLLDDTELRVGATNVFGKEPPLELNSSALYSTYGDPRLASYYLSVRKSFRYGLLCRTRAQ